MARKRIGKGITLVELLISVVLLAIVMGSVAVAMHASITSYTRNEEITLATQAARTVLNRIANDTRTAAAVTETADSATLTLAPQDPNVLSHTYHFDGTLLTWTQKTPSGQTTETLLGGTGDEVQVEAFSVTEESGLDAQGDPCIVNVVLKLKVRVGGETLLMRASASPRRNQTY